jgi:hypothetical protein
MAKVHAVLAGLLRMGRDREDLGHQRDPAMQVVLGHLEARWRAEVVVPEQHDAVLLAHLPGRHRALGRNLATVGRRHARTIGCKPKAVKRAANRLALHAPTDAHVRPHVRTVGINDRRYASFGAEHDHVAIAELAREHGSDLELMREARCEPPVGIGERRVLRHRGPRARADGSFAVKRSRSSRREPLSNMVRRA